MVETAAIALEITRPKIDGESPGNNKKEAKLLSWTISRLAVDDANSEQNLTPSSITD